MAASEQRPIDDARPSECRWQFSVRGLLLFTALVAVVLAVAVQMPFLFQVGLIIAAVVFVLIAITMALEFATSERWPVMAALSWILFGLFFVGLGLLVLWNVKSSSGGTVRTEQVFFLLLMCGCESVCLYRAGRALVRACRLGTSRPFSRDDDATFRR